LLKVYNERVSRKLCERECPAIKPEGNRPRDPADNCVIKVADSPIAEIRSEHVKAKAQKRRALPMQKRLKRVPRLPIEKKGVHE
jgi:hypothetical protein